MRPEPLHRERGLGLGAVAGESFADQAQVEGGDLAAEHALKQAIECAHERPVDAPGLAGLRDRPERVACERFGGAQQLDVLVGEVRVGGYAITAVATSSTRAASSNNSVTPSSASAG